MIELGSSLARMLSVDIVADGVDFRSLDFRTPASLPSEYAREEFWLLLDCNSDSSATVAALHCDDGDGSAGDDEDIPCDVDPC
jgi:hypothetical protein